MYPDSKDIAPNKLIAGLGRYDLLPAIIFMPTRRKCDEAATDAGMDRSLPINPERQAERVAIFDSYSQAYPEIAVHKHRRILVNAGIASHHAGHIPAWKLLIEKMMSSGLLRAIFATTTVAAGVDFPARTVVISNADIRGNDGWRALNASEVQQMTGRAGRRGKDKVGFVVLVPGQFQDARKVAEMLRSPSDPLESKFKATYTSILNLLDAFGSLDRLKEIAMKSFAFYRPKGHERGGKSDNILEREIWVPFDRRARILDHFGYLDLENETVTESGKWLADVRVDRTLLVGEAIKTGLFNDKRPPIAAGLMACLAADSDRNYGDFPLSEPLDDSIGGFESTLFAVAKVEAKYRIEPVEELNLSAAAAAERWAAGMEWADLVRRTRAEEGDLFRLLARTGEALMQVANIGKSNAKAAETCRSAAEAILREPVR